MLNLVSAFLPGVRERVEAIGAVLTPGVPDLAAGAAAVLGVALVVIGRGLIHRRRVAYLAANAALAASALAHLLMGSFLVEAVLSLAVLGVLVAHRRSFTVPPGPRRLCALVFFVPMTLGVTFGYGVAGLYLERRGIEPRLTAWLALREVAARLIGYRGPLLLPHRYVWLPVSITVIGVCLLLALASYLLAPQSEPSASGESSCADDDPDSERRMVARMVQRCDGDTLDPFALRADKSYVFSPDGRAAVAYRYVNGVGLGSGDPIGDPDAFPGAIAAFIRRCDHNGWRPALMGVRDSRLPLYEDAGLRAHYLGDEAVIDVPSFDMLGRRMRAVRQAYNRASNFGLHTDIYLERDLPEPLRAQLRDLADRARGAAPERGFSMALDGLLTGRHGDCVVAVITEPDGTPLGFQRYVPCRGGRGLSLDAMRRDRRGPNGVNERMIVDVVKYASARGIEHVSLNFAFFRAWLEAGAALSTVQSVETWLVRRFNPYFQIESLLQFNAKFHPTWVPRHVAYRALGDLPTVCLAALSAEAFLPFDRRRDARTRIAA